MRFGKCAWRVSVLVVCSVSVARVHAAPPVFDPFGEERAMASEYFVYEGSQVVFTVSAEDPDGHSLTYSVGKLPIWGHFDTTTRVFSGTAPFWSTNSSERTTNQGIHDIAFLASDQTNTVTNIVALHVLDTNWPSKTLSELVADRPISSGGDFGTPVDIDVVSDTTVVSPYAGGKTIRRVEFSFTSQVPDIVGAPDWTDDWESITNYAFLPLTTPSISNAGALIEGGYAGSWGDIHLAGRACAEFDIPTLIINRGWPDGHGADLMSKYHDKAIETRDPHHLFYVFTAPHYVRSIDALVTVINTVTNWSCSYSNFNVVITGHSKFGHTCYGAAALDPSRVTGIMPSGCPDLDTGAGRLLGNVQQAKSTKPDSAPFYLGTMMRHSVNSMDLAEQAGTNVKAILVMGTDDDKDRDEGYTAKYLLATSEKQLSMPHAVGCISNLAHTTKSDRHSTYWSMWLAHCFFGRPVSRINSVTNYAQGPMVTIEAVVSGSATVEQVMVWATNQDDLDTNHWDHFASYPMALTNGLYRAPIPSNSTAFYVEVFDLADGVTGIVSTAPTPVDSDYPLIGEPPYEVEGFRATPSNRTVKILEWKNPRSEDFDGVTIAYSPDGYPSSPVDGTQVYDGAGTSCYHNVDYAETYYYTAFTYDSQGNYDAGASTTAYGPSRPEVSEAAQIADMLTLTLTNLFVGVTNWVESSSDLVSGVWLERTNFIPATPFTNWSESVDGAQAQSFYRVTAEW